MTSHADLIRSGMNAALTTMDRQDKIWSRYSHDKVDIGEELALVIRTLSKNLPLGQQLTALSIGSSDEPQFRILETAFRGGLFLLDINGDALATVTERISRQETDHVATILADYNDIFLDSGRTEEFVRRELSGQRMDLVTLHHSLYYAGKESWRTLFANLISHVMAGSAALHAVLMANSSEDDQTTTWLYNHFAGKFCGVRNSQDLAQFGVELRDDPDVSGFQILTRTNRVKFFVDEFDKFMAVVWMILLYPQIHRYTETQREEITEFVYRRFWQPGRPLLQDQDHLVIYRGMACAGLI